MQDIRKIWDVKSLLGWSQEYFISKGINQPKLSSELLLADALNFTRMQIYLNFDHRPTEKEIARFKEYILKRVVNMPIQYILQKAFFRNLELYVDENVLIPRPETELLVDRVLNVMADIVREKAAGLDYFSGTDIPEISLNILEIGTGSGAIAISIIKEAKLFIAKSLIDAGKNDPAKTGSRDSEQAGRHLDEGNSSAGVEDPQSAGPKSFNALQADEIASFIKLKLTATEKSREALKVALKNAKNLLTEEEIKDADFIEADIIPSENSEFTSERTVNTVNAGNTVNTGNTGSLEGKINIIVSNPPYISDNNYGGLPPEVRDFEPKCALLAGDTGLEIYKKILERSPSLFGSGSSCFVFEIDPNVSLDLQKYISESMGPGKANIEIFKDYNQLDRIMVVTTIH